MKRSFLAAALVLAAAPLFASADLTIAASPSNQTIVHAGSSGFVSFTIANAGPDTASNVVVTFTVTGATESTPCSIGCAIADIPAGQSVFFDEKLTFPATPGSATMTASVTSSVADPNPAGNSVTSTITISTDPDVFVRVNAPAALDLGLPFLMTIAMGNDSQTVAHDVNVTVDFRSDALVKTLPAGCSNPAPGRVTCHTDTIDPVSFVYTTFFPVTLIAPPTFGNGSIVFAATATERENDFNPASNSLSTTYQLYNTFYVTTTANDGPGSLRQAILDVNAATTPPLAIGFRIDEPSTTPWKTIRITSPLPPITAYTVRVDGAIQTGFFGDTNPDGPEIEISGSGSVDGDGLVVTNCSSEIANLAINGFGHNGVSVIDSDHSANCPLFTLTALHHLFIGTDPTGSEARPNGQRGIGTSVPSGTDFNHVHQAANIHDCVISGNSLSGIFDLSGYVSIWGNRIGVKAHSDDPLPNGASGIFIGPGGYGSAIGADYLTPDQPGNVIAFNGQTGVAVAAGVNDVSIRGNRIWGNGLLGIDIGLDGPTPSIKSQFGVPINVPVLTLAHYDPASGKTIVEGDSSTDFTVDLYANDGPDPSGFGEGQRPIASTRATDITVTHFHIEVDGDLTGQFLTATTTHTNYVGFAKPEGIAEGFLTQTSEFSRAIEVR